VRKLFIPGFIVFLMVAFAAVMLVAGDKSVSSTAGKGTCSVFNKEACAASSKASAGTDAAKKELCGLTLEECAKLCGDGVKCEVRTISIKGMTCVGCENMVTAELQKVPGVIRVAKISYKEELALVCVDASKCQTGSLTKAVASKGYKAEIIPAVATEAAPAVEKKVTKKGCDPAACDPSACGSKKTSADSK